MSCPVVTVHKSCVKVDSASVDAVRVDDALSIELANFWDGERNVTLRGVNVSGACKLPSSPWPDAIDPKHPAFASSEVSFVGRPFPLAEARSHWARIRRSGHNLIRLVVVWEAVEHTGPGLYDEAYLSYLHDVVALARDEGLVVFIDMHQDCWSRHSGGSGAPAWTFDIAGLDRARFEDTGAALVQPIKLDAHAEPGTLWATNYTKLATNTMFTLFWAGEVYAPDAVIADPRPAAATSGEPINVGTLMRECYLNTIRRIFGALADLPNVVGLDAMNEPHPGFIGLDSLHGFDEGLYLHLGDMPTAAQSILLGSGIPQEKVPVYTKSWPWPTSQSRTRRIAPEKRDTGVWLPGRMDIWKHHGVYRIDETSDGSVFDDDYFRRALGSKTGVVGGKVDFVSAFYSPFLRSCILAAREASANSNLWLFVEPVPHTDLQPLLMDLLGWQHELDVASGVAKYRHRQRIVAAPHWYDLRALFEKRFSTATTTMDVGALAKGSRNLLAHTYWGRTGLLKNYATQIDRLTKETCHITRTSPSESSADRYAEKVPIVIGETGVPMDMNGGYTTSIKGAAQRADSTASEVYDDALDVNDGYAERITMLDATLSACERLSLGYTLWNYTPENRAAKGGGDLWNGEDFSLTYNYDAELAGIEYSGKVADKSGTTKRYALRATHGWIRPAVMKYFGSGLKSGFDLQKRQFRASWDVVLDADDAPVSVSRSIDLFVPSWLVKEAHDRPTMLCIDIAPLDDRDATVPFAQYKVSVAFESNDEQAMRITLDEDIVGHVQVSIRLEFASTHRSAWWDYVGLLMLLVSVVLYLALH